MTTSQSALEPGLGRQSSAAPAPYATAAASRHAGPIWATGILAALAWAAFGALTWRWPNQAVGFSDWAYTAELGIAALAGAAPLVGVALAGPRTPPQQRPLAALRTPGTWVGAAPLAP